MGKQGAPRGTTVCIKAHVPAERANICGSDQSAEHTVRQSSHENRIVHSLFILFQTDQKPAAAPAKTNAALQNTPVLKVRSSHRPMKAPKRIGVTMLQPNRPIIASARPSGHSPVRNQYSCLCCARSAASS